MQKEYISLYKTYREATITIKFCMSETYHSRVVLQYRGGTDLEISGSGKESGFREIGTAEEVRKQVDLHPSMNFYLSENN